MKYLHKCYNLIILSSFLLVNSINSQNNNDNQNHNNGANNEKLDNFIDDKLTSIEKKRAEIDKRIKSELIMNTKVKPTNLLEHKTKKWINESEFDKFIPLDLVEYRSDPLTKKLDF